MRRILFSEWRALIFYRLVADILLVEIVEKLIFKNVKETTYISLSVENKCLCISFILPLTRLFLYALNIYLYFLFPGKWLLI